MLFTLIQIQVTCEFHSYNFTKETFTWFDFAGHTLSYVLVQVTVNAPLMMKLVQAVSGNSETRTRTRVCVNVALQCECNAWRVLSTHSSVPEQ